MARKKLSKRARFEVFKRDSFTCQYCGAKSPEVVLHVDHITPVVAGGSDDMMNYVTACVECNLGKAAVELDDLSAVRLRRAQAEEQSARIEQIEMMAQWAKDVASAGDREIEACVQAIQARCKKWSVNNNGRTALRKLIKTFGLKAVLGGIDVAFSKYLRHDKNDEPTSESWELAFKKIGGVCAVNKAASEDPALASSHYIAGILRNRGIWFPDAAHYIYSFIELDALSTEFIAEVAKKSRTAYAFKAMLLSSAEKIQAQRDNEA